MENASAISVLDFPPEVTVMIMKNLRLVDLLRLYSAHSAFAEFRFEKSLEKSMGDITLKQLSQLYAEFATENEKNQLFHSQVFDRLKINSFNEIVHLYLEPGSQDFLSRLNPNNEILKSLGGQILLVEEPGMSYESDFWSSCKDLLEKVEGEIFLILIGIDPQQAWKGNEGENFRSRVKYVILHRTYVCPLYYRKIVPNCELIYWSTLNINGNHYVNVDPRNCVDTMGRFISIMKSNVVNIARQGSESLLAFLQAKFELHQQHEGEFWCSHCRTRSDSQLFTRVNRLVFWLKVGKSWQSCVHDVTPV